MTPGNAAPGSPSRPAAAGLASAVNLLLDEQESFRSPTGCRLGVFGSALSRPARCRGRHGGPGSLQRGALVHGPCHHGLVTVSVDFSAAPAGQRAAEIQRLCDAMEAADRAGRYPQLTVERPWSVHNPVLEGEFASPGAIRWYLERELGRLAESGARIAVSPGRLAIDLHDRRLGHAVDETRWDLR